MGLRQLKKLLAQLYAANSDDCYKTQNSIRKVAVPRQTVELLIAEHEKHPDSPLMFASPRTGGYWSPDAIGRVHKKLLAMAEIDSSVRFHDLRHTFATLAMQSGVDVKTLASMLGHYSAGFTLDTYTHITHQMQQGAAEKIGGFMTGATLFAGGRDKENKSA